jgi:hypothetical protein
MTDRNDLDSQIYQTFFDRVRNNSFSVVLRFTNLGKVLPPAFAHFPNSLAAPAVSPALNFFRSVNFSNEPTPKLYAMRAWPLIRER